MSVTDLPFDVARQQLDAEAAACAIHKLRPGLVMLGRSVVLGPDDLAPVAEAASSVGALTIYDASHVAGLIAGGVFPNPLETGIDMMTMSTHKTLGGPTGAIVCGRRTSDGEAFTSTVNRAFLANQDASRYPVLLASLLPFCDGTDEAPRVIDNATAFKAALEAEGLPTLLPGEIAASHQVVVPTGKLPETLSLMRALENASILVGRCPHPGTPDGYGLRFGTQYATRLGLGTTEMEAAARIVGRLMGRRDATAQLVEGHAEKIPNVCEAIQSLLAPFSINKDRAPYEAT